MRDRDIEREREREIDSSRLTLKLWMQGEWEGGVEEEEPEWISSSDSPAAEDPDSEECEEEQPNLQEIAAVVLQDIQEREQFARVVARAGGIEPGRVVPAPEPQRRTSQSPREREETVGDSETLSGRKKEEAGPGKGRTTKSKRAGAGVPPQYPCCS